MKLQIILIKLSNIFSTFFGWLLAIFIAVGNFFAGHIGIINIVLFAVIIDAFWGIFVSVKQGKFVLSELARLSISKLLVYGCVLALFIAIDKMLGGSLVVSSTIVATLIVLVEAWSTLASMIIVYPDMAFLRLLRKVLKGEIASKLGIEESQVDSYFVNKKSKKN